MPEIAVGAARVERIAAEANRERLERQVRVELRAGLPALLHEIEDLLGGAREDLPGLVEVRLLDVTARGAGRQER